MLARYNERQEWLPERIKEEQSDNGTHVMGALGALLADQPRRKKNQDLTNTYPLDVTNSNLKVCT